MERATGHTGNQSSKCKVRNRQGSLLRKLKPYMSSNERAGALTRYKLSAEGKDQKNVWNIGRSKSDKLSKVIMLVGETGSGKTTLLNALVNFILGVGWEDGHRFELNAESRGMSQAHSQTSEVTTYNFHHEDELGVPYSVSIIDTPGFGDTRGIHYDKKIMQQIRHFFGHCGFSEIDAICFVVQASMARLTATQIYIYNSILSIFGKDIKDNILFFTTFADSNKPVVLSAITEAKIPCAQSENGIPVHFKVNNSMLYANNCPKDDEEEDECTMNEGQWKISMKSIERFLSQVLPKLSRKSLCLTKEVLEEINALEVTLEGLMMKLKEMTMKQHEKEEIQRQLTSRQGDIEKKANAEFQVKTIVKEKNYSPYKSTNCRNCESTCHQDCCVPFLLSSYWCEVFTWGGTCKVCSHKSGPHTSDKFYYTNAVKTQTRSYQEIKEEYEKKDKKYMEFKDVLAKLQSEVETFDNEVQRLIQGVIKSNQRLQEIALKPSPMSDLDYIDLLIEGEKKEAKEGFKERIQVLEKHKAKLNLMKKYTSQKK